MKPDTAPGAPEPLGKRRQAWLLWAVPLLWAIALAVSFQIDAKVIAWVTSNREMLREPLQWALLGTGVLITIQGARSLPNGNRLLIGFLVPIIVSTLVTHLLKFSIGRARPFVGEGAAKFAPFLANGGEYASFPSGHTQYAFVLATLWCLYWPKMRWVAMLWAPIVAFERLYSEKHFLSDVLAGAAIGVVTTLFIVKLLGPNYYRMSVGTETPAEAQG
jgi:membrane-associated phospholipid phosphatase